MYSPPQSCSKKEAWQLVCVNVFGRGHMVGKYAVLNRVAFGPSVAFYSSRPVFFAGIFPPAPANSSFDFAIWILVSSIVK